MVTRRNLLLQYWALVVLVLAAGALLHRWETTLGTRLRAIAFDTYQQIAPRPYDPAAPVRIVDIDEVSLTERGQWPWPRTEIAALVAKLEDMGAVAIVFDMVFPEPDRLSPDLVAKRLPKDPALTDAANALAAMPSNDSVLAQAISQAAVVTAFVGVPDATGRASLPPRPAEIEYKGNDPRLFLPSFPQTVVNLPVLTQHAAGSGFNNWIPEHDQIIRKLPMLITVGQEIYPSIALEALRLAQGYSNYLILSSGAEGERSFGTRTGIAKVLIGGVFVPTDETGQMWLHFSRRDPRRYLSAARVLDGSVKPDDIKGKIVLIGTSAAGLLDIRATPVDAAMPGVEAHAQAIEQMLAGDYIVRPDFAPGAEIIFSGIAGLILALAVYGTGAAVGSIVGGFAVASVIAISWLSYTRQGWLFDPVFATGSLSAVYLAASGFLRLVTERERNASRMKLQRIAQEMEAAAQIQRSFLPKEDLITAGHTKFDLYATMQPAKDVGGDFYDYFMVADGKLAFAIGDVSGKGVPAALFMSVSRTVLRTVAFEVIEPGPVLTRVNAILARDNSEGMFVTVFYGVLDLETGVLSLSSAGHDDSYLLTGKSEAEILRYMGPAVGLLDGADYPTVSRQLSKGDAIFLLTDGITEAFNIDGRVFTAERLEKLVATRCEPFERQGHRRNCNQGSLCVFGRHRAIRRHYMRRGAVHRLGPALDCQLVETALGLVDELSSPLPNERDAKATRLQVLEFLGFLWLRPSLHIK